MRTNTIWRGLPVYLCLGLTVWAAEPPPTNELPQVAALTVAEQVTQLRSNVAAKLMELTSKPQLNDGDFVGLSAMLEKCGTELQQSKYTDRLDSAEKKLNAVASKASELEDPGNRAEHASTVNAELAKITAAIGLQRSRLTILETDLRQLRTLSAEWAHWLDILKEVMPPEKSTGLVQQRIKPVAEEWRSRITTQERQPAKGSLPEGTRKKVTEAFRQYDLWRSTVSEEPRRRLVARIVATCHAGSGTEPDAVWELVHENLLRLASSLDDAAACFAEFGGAQCQREQARREIQKTLSALTQVFPGVEALDKSDPLKLALAKWGLTGRQ
jgi:hypothetical protein